MKSEKTRCCFCSLGEGGGRRAREITRGRWLYLRDYPFRNYSSPAFDNEHMISTIFMRKIIRSMFFDRYTSAFPRPFQPPH